MGTQSTSQMRQPCANLVRRGHLAAVLFLMGSLLYGCGGPEPKAPEPTVNPNPHEFTKLKITVEPGSDVDNVEVYSIWAIGNIGCAPTRYPSGSSVQKEIQTKEKVEKVGSDGYLATITSDRFLPGICRWNGDGYGIRFMHGQKLLGVDGEEKKDLESSMSELTCVPDDDPPTCFSRSRKAFFKSRFEGVFNAVVRIEK